MALVAFNTHEFIKSLEDVGMSEDQAEAISAGILRAHEMAGLATKADLRELKAETKADLQEVKAEMREMELRIDKKLTEMKGESMLVRWMLGLIMAGIAGLVVKAFFGA